MTKIYICGAVALLCAMAANAGTNNEINTVTSTGRQVSVTAVNPYIIKVSNHARESKSNESAAVNIHTPLITAQTTTAGRTRVLATSGGITAMLDTVNGSIVIDGGVPRVIGDNGMRRDSLNRKWVSVATMSNGAFYGAGERGYKLNLQGDTLIMYNKQNYGYTAGENRIKQMNICMPFVISDQGYGIFFDDYAAAWLAVENGTLTYSTEGKEDIDYYYINGNGSIANVVEQWTALVGRQQLPPVWALGYITSKYGYKTEAETRSVIDSLKRGGYPLDGVVLDLYWYGKEEDMGRLAWDADQWPDHKGMLRDFKKCGVNTVIISQPYILSNGRGADNFNYLSNHGMLAKDSLGGIHPVTIWVGQGGMLDVANPDTKAWLRDRYSALTDEGVTGWWGDLGEPEVHPEGAIHANGKTAREYHNQYGNDWSEIIFNLFQDKYPDTRLMTMMRGGTAGLQRYNVFPWSTDVSRSWGGLKPQVNIMLNSGMSGLGYMSHDVGGFAVDSANPVDPELYVRWLQLGTFSPVLRTHSTVDAEPYHYPQQEKILKSLIDERYKWLPYNYTLAYENAAKGWPLVRPLNFHGGNVTQDNADEYMWGHDLLVAPVLEQGADKRVVVMPEGSWVDYLNPSGKIYTTGDSVTYQAPLDVLPRFVRLGAFIVQADNKMENTGDFTASQYHIYYYPKTGYETSGMIYEDDHANPKALEQNQYAIMTLNGIDNNGKTEITATMQGNYPGMPDSRNLTFTVYRVNNKPGSVVINGKKLSARKWDYNAGTKSLSFSTNWQSSKPMHITVE
jgi:oligosaccharide 4-alpha-D-glucosyltransferase